MVRRYNVIKEKFEKYSERRLRTLVRLYGEENFLTKKPEETKKQDKAEQASDS